MLITEQIKSSVLDSILTDFGRKSGPKGNQITKVRHANSLGINPSVYSRLMNGETDRVLSEAEWIRIGMELGTDMMGYNWQTATTPVYRMIWQQLDYCRKNGLAGIFCDEKGIGKSHVAKMFARAHSNVAYVDCSQAKTKRELIREIARKFGFDYRGKLSEVRRTLTDNILTLDKPLLILDEVGDVSYEAFLEIKSLWNSVEYVCGFYMMGANGLRVKINRQIDNRKVGFEEIFDRFGDRYQHIYSDLTEAQKAMFKRQQAEGILKVNLPHLDKKAADTILNASALNLRRLRIEIIKYKNSSCSLKGTEKAHVLDFENAEVSNGE